MSTVYSALYPLPPQSAIIWGENPSGERAPQPPIAPHAVDSKDGDRKKFFHSSVETEFVGNDEEQSTRQQSNQSNRGMEQHTGGEDKFTDFVKWMKKHGAQFPDQHLVKYTEENRGVHAMKDISGKIE